jgi:hypothetical protein
MADISPYQQLRRIDFTINGFALAADIDRRSSVERKAFEALRRNARAAQAILKDYEMSEAEEDTRLQLKLLPRAVNGLERMRESLLKASEYDLVGAVDVAQLSAQLDELIDRLR